MLSCLRIWAGQGKYTEPKGVTQEEIKAGLYRLTALPRDLSNRLRFGPAAPRVAERLWIDPARLVWQADPLPPRSWSGRVVATGWPQGRVAVRDNPKIRYCLAHWRSGADWDAAGAIAFFEAALAARGRIDGLRNMDRIRARLAGLDAVFAQIRAEGRLRPRDELPGRGFRERGGIYVHIGAGGEPYFGGGGQHRLAMALALELPLIPVQLGVVSCDALVALPALRRDPRSDLSLAGAG